MKTNKLTHGSLFSGIGGFEIGAAVSGIETLYNCEIENFQRSILKTYFYDSIQYKDIRDISKVPYTDIISGGFPCQDISIAGKGIGIIGEKSGLWFEMLRIIRNVRPGYVIIENSPMLLSRGFERVLYGLSESGYNAEWSCISNAFFGFPHKRVRLYIIAIDTDKIRRPEIPIFPSLIGEEEKPRGGEFSRMSSGAFWSEDYAELAGMDNGFSDPVHRLESVGNAVNPVLAAYLFRLIQNYDSKQL